MKKLVIISLILVFLDQITKYFIPGTTNIGAAFGILQGWQWLFVLVSGVVLGFIFYYKDKVKGYGFYGLAFLLSGVIGNLIDRLLFGYVRDFIDVGFWPIFNLADSYNTTGVILLVIWFWKNG